MTSVCWILLSLKESSSVNVLIINSTASPAWHFRPPCLIPILLHSLTAPQCCFKTWGETCRKAFYSEEGWVLPVQEISQEVCFLSPTATEWWKECEKTGWIWEIHADYQTLAQKRCDGHRPGSCCPSALSSPDLSWHGCNTSFCIRENLQNPAVAGTSEQCFSKSRVWSKACKAPWHSFSLTSVSFSSNPESLMFISSTGVTSLKYNVPPQTHLRVTA